MNILVSACLAGLHCRYDGKDKSNEYVIRLVAEGNAIPVCPEQLGGLPTPRPCSQIKGDRVITEDGGDVTSQFHRGAEEALSIAKITAAKKAILKSKSPSCGSGQIYDGNFTGKLISGDGIFAALCKQNGIEVITEEDI